MGQLVSDVTDVLNYQKNKNHQTINGKKFYNKLPKTNAQKQI